MSHPNKPSDAPAAPCLSPFADWAGWLSRPSGQQLARIEQDWLDSTLADVFGYTAFSVAPPGIDPLAANRMPFRGRLCFGEPLPETVLPAGQAVVCRPEALPLAAESLDLLVLVHALELVDDPHGLLREAERVLIPEGHLVIVGLNPHSLWALHQPLAAHHFPPVQGEPISASRMKDWCRLLGFSIEGGFFGLYRPVCQTQDWWRRLSWLEAAGARWWPGFGAVYGLHAVKRRQGMRLITPTWSDAKPEPGASAVISQKEQVRP